VMREDNCVIRLTKMTSVSDSDERTSQAERCGFTISAAPFRQFRELRVASFCLTSVRHQSRTISGSACSALRTLAYALRDKWVGCDGGWRGSLHARGERRGAISSER
jgi:hypothetical protein